MKQKSKTKTNADRSLVYVFSILAFYNKTSGFRLRHIIPITLSTEKTLHEPRVTLAHSFYRALPQGIHYSVCYHLK